jgi:S-DNA-T family DNA segregation ATPase FtsK/SpoIIIE
VQDESNIRFISIVSSVVLGLTGVILLMLTLGAFVPIPALNKKPIAYLVRVFGLSALFIPAVFIGASLFILKSSLSITQTFLVCASLLPLFTCMVGYAFLHTFSLWVERFIFFRLLQQNGFIIFLVFLIAFEITIILAVKEHLFSTKLATHINNSVPRRAKKYRDSRKKQTVAKIEELEYITASHTVNKKNFHSDFTDIPHPQKLKSAEIFAESNGEIRDESIPESDLNISNISEQYVIPTKILEPYTDLGRYWIVDEHTKKTAALLIKILEEFHIPSEYIFSYKGHAVSLFEVKPAQHIVFSQMYALQDALAKQLSVEKVRIIPRDEEKRLVGIEIPNKERLFISFREIMEGELRKEKRENIPLIIGKDVISSTHIVDLSKIPHLLIAGEPHSGLSVCLNVLLLSMIYCCKPLECTFFLIDLKSEMLHAYTGIPHLRAPVIHSLDEAIHILRFCTREMERRFKILEMYGVHTLEDYRKERALWQSNAEILPDIVVVINEYADLILQEHLFEILLNEFGMRSSLVGMHIILTTQEINANVINAAVKDVIPARIALKVTTITESRLIIDIGSAEQLLGKGDMVYRVGRQSPIRIQGAFVSQQDVERTVNYLIEKHKAPPIV